MIFIRLLEVKHPGRYSPVCTSDNLREWCTDSKQTSLPRAVLKANLELGHNNNVIFLLSMPTSLDNLNVRHCSRSTI